jgi:hypothetical protein
VTPRAGKFPTWEALYDEFEGRAKRSSKTSIIGVHFGYAPEEPCDGSFGHPPTSGRCSVVVMQPTQHGNGDDGSGARERSAVNRNGDTLAEPLVRPGIVEVAEGVLPQHVGLRNAKGEGARRKGEGARRKGEGERRAAGKGRMEKEEAGRRGRSHGRRLVHRGCQLLALSD